MTDKILAKTDLWDAIQGAIDHARLQIQAEVDRMSLENQQLKEHLEQEKLKRDEQIIQHERLISKLKEKIDELVNDHQQQISHLQNKLDYQKAYHDEQMALKTREYQQVNHDAQSYKNQFYSLQQEYQGIKDSVSFLEHQLKEKEQFFTEGSERIRRLEHNLKLAHEEHERSQLYITELEEKNNTIQKELFENWILHN